MIIIQEENFAKAYQKLLAVTLNAPEYVTSPRNMLCHEHMNVIMRIDNPKECLYKNPIRSSQNKYISAELLWYFSGSDKTSDIEPHAPFWKMIENADGTVNSAYGARLFQDINEHGYTEWDWALHSLTADNDTRQAVLRINKPEHSRSDNKDFPCTLTITFHIRGNKLNMTVHMRSNDIIKGLPTDFAFFATLQAQMLEHLQSREIDVNLGSYVHLVDSMHLYENDFEKAKNMLEYDFTPASMFDEKINLIYQNGQMTNEFSAMHKFFETKTLIETSTFSTNNTLHEYISTNYNSWVESRT